RRGHGRRRGLQRPRRSGRFGRSVPLAHLEHDERRADRDLVARRAADRYDSAADGRRHFHRRFVGHHLDDELILGHGVARLGMPGDDFRIHRAFAQIRHLEYVLAHDGSMTALSAIATRAWPGKYSHSKAWGYGVSQPATRWIGASRSQKHSSWTTDSN